MKVKVSKTIDVNQIPGEVRRMIDQTKNDLLYGLPDQMSQVVRSSLSSHGTEFFSTIEMIDAFRRNLAVFDENLQEIQTVLVGYKNAVMPESEEKSPSVEEHNLDWLEREEAQYEKMMAQSDDKGEAENEEG